MDIHNLLFERNITKNFLSKDIYNQILFESDNFLVIPSLGSMVKGWLLIVPKEYALSMGHLDSVKLQELEELSNKVSEILEKEFGRVIMFEHGAALPNDLVGCGVDYAHLHLVPVNIDLIKELEMHMNIKYDWESVSNLDFASIFTNQNLPYLYVKTGHRHLITSNKNIPSQLFRRVIANFLNISNQFDWKLFNGIENIQETINVLSKYPRKFLENKYYSFNESAN